jgi:hypothetical protein
MKASMVVPSPLYKYRSLDKWEFLEDIFQRSRLYAATFRLLNDPMEGLLYEHDKDVSVKYRNAVRTATGRLNICSLSDSRDNTLLWSYYAGGHSGVAIGVVSQIASAFADAKLGDRIGLFEAKRIKRLRSKRGTTE